MKTIQGTYNIAKYGGPPEAYRIRISGGRTQEFVFSLLDQRVTNTLSSGTFSL